MSEQKEFQCDSQALPATRAQEPDNFRTASLNASEVIFQSHSSMCLTWNCDFGIMMAVTFNTDAYIYCPAYIISIKIESVLIYCIIYILTFLH